jgi:hypothetical protein
MKWCENSWDQIAIASFHFTISSIFRDFYIVVGSFRITALCPLNLALKMAQLYNSHIDFLVVVVMEALQVLNHAVAIWKCIWGRRYARLSELYIVPAQRQVCVWDT